MSIEEAQIVSLDAVPFYVDAGISTVINSIVAGAYSISGNDFLEEVNTILTQNQLPEINGDLLLQIISDRKALGEFTGFVIFQTEIPPAVDRPVAPGGIAADGSFFSTPTSGIYRVRVYKNGALVYESEPVDLSVNRSLNNTGFVQGDVMQVALVSGGVVGWWGRVTIS